MYLALAGLACEYGKRALVDLGVAPEDWFWLRAITSHFSIVPAPPLGSDLAYLACLVDRRLMCGMLSTFRAISHLFSRDSHYKSRIL